MPIKVTISGAAGAGKSSIIQYLVKKLGYETADIGQIFRSRAIAKKLTIAEYDKLVERHPEEDKALEKEFTEIVKASKKNIVVSRRMGFHCLPEILSIWLDVEPKEGARRIFLQDRGKQEKKYKNVAEAMKASEDRMKRLQKRLLHVYGVDFMNKKNYTKVIKTDGKSIEETAQAVIKAIQEYEKSHKKN